MGPGTSEGYVRWSHSCNSEPYTVLKPGGVGPRRGVASTQRQVGIENIIRNRANYVVIAVVEGSETVVDGKRISTGMG